MTIFMGNLASDHDAAIELIIGEYRKLQAHNPQHELLQYITIASLFNLGTFI
jgi:hypothetical protein